MKKARLEGWSVGLYEIGPKDARDMQSRMMENQRSMSEASVRNLVAEMLADKFGVSNDAIVVTASGIVINGQHRLEMIVRTGKAGVFIVLTVPDNEMTKTLRLMDCGVPRTVGHVAAITTGVTNASTVASVAKFVLAYDRGLVTNQGCYASTNRTVQDKYVSRDEILDYITAHAKALQDSASTAKSLNAEYGLLGTTGPACVHYIITRRYSRKDADAFLNVAFSGKGERSDSVEPLRKALIKDLRSIRKVSSAIKVASLFKAFRSWAQGTMPRKGFVNPGESFPKV